MMTAGMMEPPGKADRPSVMKVTAAVIEKDGLVLIARRKSEGGHGGLWEFPGGKIEPGETPEEALKRELGEEFGVAADVGDFLGSFHHENSGTTIELLVYRTHLPDGEPRPIDHEEIRWVAPEDMDESLFTGPDRPVIRRLIADRAADRM